MILIAGPCVIESRENLLRVAEKLVNYHEDESIDFYFKSSFDKSSPEQYAIIPEDKSCI